jgi:hypothetical protein
MTITSAAHTITKAVDAYPISTKGVLSSFCAEVVSAPGITRQSVRAEHDMLRLCYARGGE